MRHKNQCPECEKQLYLESIVCRSCYDARVGEITVMQNARKREKYTLRKKQKNAFRLDTEIRKLRLEVENLKKGTKCYTEKSLIK